MELLLVVLTFPASSANLVIFLSINILIILNKLLRNCTSRGYRSNSVWWCYQLAANVTAFWNRELSRPEKT